MAEAARQSSAARVGVASRAPILADGVSALIDDDPTLTCVIACNDPGLALSMLRDDKLDLLVLDEDLLDDDLVASVAVAPQPSGALVVLGSSGGRAQVQLLGSLLADRLRVVEKSAGLAGLTDCLHDSWTARADRPTEADPPLT